MLVPVVYIRSRRGGHPALKCHPDGKIQANCYGPANKWEKWILHSISGNNNNDDSCPTTCRVAFESWTGQFLSAKLDGTVFAADVLDECCHWELQSTTGNFVSLKSHFGRFLCCDDFDNCGKFVRVDRLSVEEWIIVDGPKSMVMTKKGDTARRGIVGALVGLGAVVSLGPLAIPRLGFGVGGVVAGSVAAGVQSAVYGGATGGLFSVLQASGATLAWVPIAAGGGVVACAGVVAGKTKHR
jgi:hypothetical protein